METLNTIPEKYLSFPSSSVLQNWERERIALNINIIRNRLGLGFVPITEELYKEERLKDGNWNEIEITNFRVVIPNIITEVQCQLFCPKWGKNEKI